MKNTIKVKLYLNFDGEPESIEVKCKKEPVLYLQKVIFELENDFPMLARDEWYTCKMKRRYADDGSGAMRFDGYDIVSIRSCTKHL